MAGDQSRAKGGTDIRNPQNAEGESVVNAIDPADSSMAVVAEAEDFVPIEIDQEVWAVMVRQIVRRGEIIGQLLAYVDSGLTDAIEIRVREKQSGIKRYDVYVAHLLPRKKPAKPMTSCWGCGRHWGFVLRMSISHK